MEENIYPEVCRLSRGVQVMEEWELGTRILLHRDEDGEYVFAFDPRTWAVKRAWQRIDTFQLITKEPCSLIYGNDLSTKIRSYEQAVEYAKRIFTLRSDTLEGTLYDTPNRLVS